jgi:ubiquinone/menaquinone biosynthesis C-methylase UbiE
MIELNNKYTLMQRSYYNDSAQNWTPNDPNHVVGSFHEHNAWEDYRLLFECIQNQKEKIALDFACGPGRNLVKYQNDFQRLDGIDISEINIKKAREYCNQSNILNNKLYISNGINLDVIEDNSYDVVMSTIALQHICVYDIRFSIFSDIYRILKSGGVFTARMGYGSPSPNTVDYYANHYDAKGTNRACDVCISSSDQIQSDILKIGFINFQYTIARTGPGDCHPNWIYFHAIKPPDNNQ